MPETAGDPVLILRTCNSDMTSHGGFRWPESGPVEAPDWNPAPVCGGGLHGFAWGEGDGGLANWSLDARWLVAEVDPADVVDLNGKVKFPRAVVVHCGDRLSATAFLASRATGRAIVGGTATAGYEGTATAGYEGTATAGDAGTATAGYEGTATAGDAGTATAGYAGTATAGYAGTIVLTHWDGKRRRLVVAYVGESGIEPRVPYRCNCEGRLVRANDESSCTA